MGLSFKGGIYRVQKIETGKLSDCMPLEKILKLRTLAVAFHSQYMVQIHAHHSNDRFRVNQDAIIAQINIKVTFSRRSYKVNRVIQAQPDLHLFHDVHTPYD